MSQEPDCSLWISFVLSHLEHNLGFSFVPSPWASAPRCPAEGRTIIPDNPPVNLSPWWTPNITLGQKMSSHWPSQGQCFYLCCFQGPNLPTTFFFLSLEFLFEVHKSPKILLLFLFSIPLIVRISSLALKYWGKKTPKTQPGFSIYVLVSSMQKQLFISPLIHIKLNLKANIKTLFRI